MATVRLVAVVLVTGMSGVGKSTALAELAHRGHRMWREERIHALLSDHRDSDGALFVSGTVRNQGAAPGPRLAASLRRALGAGRGAT